MPIIWSSLFLKTVEKEPCLLVVKKKFNSIITFTGHNKKNSVSRLGNINMWVDSKAYNIVENIHQTWLLSIVDLIIGKKEYPPN